MITEELFRELVDIVYCLSEGDAGLRHRIQDIQTALDERRSLSLVRRERQRQRREQEVKDTIDAVYPNGSD